jgi:stress-induced-phosphoprotein 1
MNADSLKELGNEAFRKKNFQEAIKHYTDAIALAPTNSVLFSNRAAVHLTMNLLDEALRDAREAVRLDRSNTKGLLRIGKALYALGKYSDAIIEGLEPALETKPDDKTKTEIEDCLKRAKAALPKEGYKGKTFEYAHGKRYQWPDNRAEEMGIKQGM